MNTVDSLPELYPYRDEGCALSPSCLRCPFPSCLDERPRGRQRWLKEQRCQAIARLHSQGKSTRDLARIFGVSQRTIQRALATMATSSRHCEGRSPEAIRPSTTRIASPTARNDRWVRARHANGRSPHAL